MDKKRKRFVIWLTPSAILKIIMSLFLVALIGFIYTNELPTTKTWSDWTMPLSGRTIVLDAGHGGVDGGASSKSGVVEKDINLAISTYIRDYLQQAGAIVYMIREEDTDLAAPDTKGYSKRKTEDLKARVKFIEDKKADMFLSIHMNAVPSSKWNGAQTFYYPIHQENYTLATLIQEELKRNLSNTDRTVKRIDKGIFILENLKMPSALIEAGFLSNPTEAQQLRTKAYQQKVAASIYQGILRYYSGEKVGPT
ncbi:N-acetylmuramoyl-L-alanine amidase CwlD [Paenibacillus sp. N1-5-1-14]|uniref:N-acetylmuramoyl-L-alanine amidase CwlD n=1 Tax=Paenibacillus radicibacter TaxID=2972488 RepID=UPI002159759E|nr:N-acetylmuramoyl-L-alanine amidase CwlD [Paenibacillus radicibacter]MCR8645760.1 N-acetylmuramoyl-L-alanine amidase CwlD [Paenibacillus radicibacter]